MNALYPHIHVSKPSPPAPQNRTIFGDKALKEVIKLKTRPLRWALLQPNRCPYKKRSLRPTEKHQGCACAEEKGHMRTQQGGSHLTSQGQRPQGKPTLMAHGSGTSSLQDCEKIHSCSLSHSVFSILLGQPKQTKTEGNATGESKVGVRGRPTLIQREVLAKVCSLFQIFGEGHQSTSAN